MPSPNRRRTGRPQTNQGESESEKALTPTRRPDAPSFSPVGWPAHRPANPSHRQGNARRGFHPPQPYLALTNANVLDVRTGEILENRTVVLQDGLIQSITTGAPPQGADVQNVNGYYMLPGFFDGHFHGRTLDAAQFALESGVTTVLSAGAYGMQDMTFRDAVTAGYFPGPDMLAAGVFVLRHLGDNALEDPRLFKFMNVELEGAENLRRVVQVNFERGVDLSLIHISEPTRPY